MFILNGFLRRTLQNTAIIILYLWWQTETFFLQFFMSQFINVFVDFLYSSRECNEEKYLVFPSLHFQISQRNLLVSTQCIQSPSRKKIHTYALLSRHQPKSQLFSESLGSLLQTKKYLLINVDKTTLVSKSWWTYVVHFISRQTLHQ